MIAFASTCATVSITSYLGCDPITKNARGFHLTGIHRNPCHERSVPQGHPHIRPSRSHRPHSCATRCHHLQRPQKSPINLCRCWQVMAAYVLRQFAMFYKVFQTGMSYPYLVTLKNA